MDSSRTVSHCTRKEKASEQASKREPAHDAWRTKPAQKIDSRTLVHTVGGRVSSPWGPTRDVAHPPVNAERAAGAKRTDGSPARGASATITSAGGPTGLTVACALSHSAAVCIRHAMFPPYLPAGMHVSEPHSSRVWVWGPGLGRLRFAVGRLGNSEWEWRERSVRHGMVDVDFQPWAMKMKHVFFLTGHWPMQSELNVPRLGCHFKTLRSLELDKIH